MQIRSKVLITVTIVLVEFCFYAKRFKNLKEGDLLIVKGLHLCKTALKPQIRIVIMYDGFSDGYTGSADHFPLPFPLSGGLQFDRLGL